MPRTSSKTTTQRGLGWKHQQDAQRLHRRHTDGTLCWWCNHPMFTTPEANWDTKRLAADHTQPRAFGGTRADRLLHATCNQQRGDGSRDHQRPALTNTHPSQWSTRPTAAAIPDTALAMDW